MKGMEILVITGMAAAGLGLLSLTMGIIPALNLIGLVVGGYLLVKSVGVILEMIGMKADATLATHKAHRQGEMMAEMADSARYHHDSLQGGHGKPIDATGRTV